MGQVYIFKHYLEANKLPRMLAKDIKRFNNLNESVGKVYVCKP